MHNGMNTRPCHHCLAVYLAFPILSEVAQLQGFLSVVDGIVQGLLVTFGKPTMSWLPQFSEPNGGFPKMRIPPKSSPLTISAQVV